MKKNLLLLLTILFTVGIGQMWGADTWKLVTSVSDLAVGDEVVIVASSANNALSTTQNNNNRGQASVTKSTSDKTVSWTSSSAVQVLTIKAGTSSGTFAFYTGSGYLYAASSTSNHLKTQTTNNANGSWDISITSNGVATIKAKGSNSRNWLRYNSSSSIFSCYSSGQGDVCIYKKAATCTQPTISWATAPTDGNVGETMTASVSTNYSNGLSYSSSDTDVATIDNSGKITYKAAGTTTITASVTGDGTTYCSDTVSVTKEITVSKSCTSITPLLSYSPATIVIDETTSPTLTGNTGNGTVTYLSNNTSVATVDASTGTVTAISAGTATITANIAANGDYCAGSATFEITVNKKSATITLYEAGSTSNPSGTFYVDDSYTLPSSDATCDGKEFVGWSTEQIQTPTDNPTATIHAAGTNVTLKETNTFYAVFATVGEPEGTTTEEVTRTYTFSYYTAGTQYASNEEHVLDDDVTIYTTKCHFTTQLRIYSSGENDGYVISNQLPGRIVSIGMNAGNKKDNVLVYGSTDGSSWKQVGSISVTSTSYNDYTSSFGNTNYTYFKLDVDGSNQVRLQSLTITWETSAASNEPTYSQYTTSCSGKTGTTLTWSADKYLTTINGDTNFPTLTTSPADLTGVTYSSSNTSVATINATTGAITIKGLGETTITASFAGNDTYDAATDATYTLTVADIYTVSYAVGNGDTAPVSNTVVQGNTITLPDLNTTLNCVSFVGWTDDQSGYTHGTSQLLKAGTEYTPTATITLHAVYGVGGGYVLVEDVATLTAGMQVIIANTDNKVAMGEDRGNNRGVVSVSISDKTLTPAGGVEIFTLEEGTTNGTFAFKTSAGYLYAASSSSNYLKTQTTKDANGSWKITITNGVASIIAQGSNSRKMMQYNSSSSLFACYATTTTNQKPVSLYAQGIANYTTDPACVTYSVTTCTPANGTISVNPSTVDPYGSTTVTFTPASGYMLQAVAITSGTAEVGTPSYTTNQISGGTVKITNIQSDIEVCATFVEIPYYKVTFVDMNNNNSTQTVSQSDFGADIVAPSTASAGCDVTWTFIGWAPSNDLNGATEEPAGLVAPGGTISGSSITDNNQTYYSVYSNSSDGTPPFSIGKSGTYYFKVIKEDASVLYATNALNSSSKYPTNSTPNIPFLLVYNSTNRKYTIKNTLTNKYLQPNSYDMNQLAEEDASYDWNIVNGVSDNSKTGEFLFTYLNSSSNTRYLYCDGSNFGSWSKDNSKYALYLEPASEMRYYNASSCIEFVTMFFDVPENAELTYEVGYPEDYYKETNKKIISTFPTLTYEGWTFIGWTAGTSYNDQIGDANLDDENASAAAPSSIIYNTGGSHSYNLNADVTMYPIFTKFSDNEPFDIINGGEYYIYYIADGDIATSVDKYGAAQRIYAASWTGEGAGSYSSTQSCANATLFTFTKLDSGKWTIYDNASKDFLYARNRDISHRAQEQDGTKNIKEWDITIYDGNQFKAVAIEGYTLSANSTDAINGTFKNYDTDNFSNNSKYYHRVYLGGCTERVYSSGPSKQLTVTWNPNGGKWEDGSTFKITDTYQKDSRITKPTNPTRTGYTFKGWHDGTAIVTPATTMPDHSLTYTAQWTANTITITWNANGGSVSPTTSTYTYDGATVELPTPTRTGYTFNGWYTAATGGTQITEVGTTNKPTEDVTYYAHWTVNTHTLTWDVNGGNALTGDYTKGNVDFGTPITAPETPTRTGYTFKGWNDGTGIVTPETTMPDHSLTYTAIWEINQYTVTWKLAGGSVNGSTADIVETYNYGATITAPADPTRTGYTFAGWSPNVAATMPAENTTYTAQWTANTNTPYVVEHYQQALDGTYPTTPTDKDSFTGTTDTQVTPAVKSYPGFTAPATQTVTIAAAGNLVVKYYYTRNSYTLGWDFQEGTPLDNNYTLAGKVVYGTSLTAPTLTREGWTFVGWDPSVPATMPAENITYVAQWHVNTYTVTWVPNGGNWSGSTNNIEETYNYSETINIPANPTRAGYTFNGWSPVPAATMPAANQTYTAQWNCVAPTDLHIEGEFIHFPGDDITLTVVGDNIADDATYVWKQGETLLPDQTTATLTINHCDVTHAGNYVCTVTNGTCSAEANFTVKMFHLYGLKDNTWTQPYVFMKDAEANKAILYVDLDAATSYDFKLKNGREWYWNEGTMTHNQCTDWIMPQEGDVTHGNTWITTTVAGTYAFKLDYTDAANLILSVVYPAKQMIYLEPGVWNTDGAIFVAHVWTEGVGNDKDIRMTKVNDCADREIYEAEIEGAHNRVIFVRCNPSGFNINNIWNTEWNRSSTQWLTNTLPGYQFNIEEWGNGGTEDGKTCSKGSWSAFIPYHTISYDMNGHGTQIEDNCIEDGDTWSAPNDPTAVGYTFLGWRRPAATGDSKLYKKDQNSYKPTASETLTAQWQINRCVVTWKVNAQEVTKTTVDIANPLTTIPYTPADDALGCCAEKFIGWSTETNPTKSQVYTTASELQTLIGTLAANTTKTFHAVFATPVPGAGTSLVTFSEMGYANEEAVTSVTLGDGLGNGDATITFNKGTAATYVPTYYNIGEAVRTYAGNTITVAATYANTVLTQIDFAFAKGENDNAITASTGSITDGTWTGTAESVTFTIGGTTGHRRIASIAVTTEVTGDQYTNYVTKCDLSNSASIGAATLTYANGTAIDVKCGQRSPASKAATLTFASAQDLTCPVTIEASAGFLVSTNKNDNSKYASSITVKPVKTGANKGKLPTIYVRAEANFGVSGQMNGTITASGDEITTTQVNVLANVTCTQYTLTVVDHLGNTISTTPYYEGDEVAKVNAPATDDCSKDYTFDGWSETSVEYGSPIYNKVSFPYSMPANDVTLYPVYVCSKDYHRVTEDLGADNWEGQYLIAHSNTEFANGYQGGTTDGNCIGGTNSVRDLSQYITNDVVSKDCDVRSVKLIAVNGGYVLQTRDGKYNFITAGVQSGLTANDNLSTADDHPLTIIFNSETDIAITNLANVNQASLQYSATYFRFYKPGNQNPVYLYKKYLYTTPLICGSIEAEDAVVTSTAGQTIKVNVPVTLESTLGGKTTITAESDNDHFTVTPLENVTAGDHTIAVHYKPADDATSDDTEIANITLTASHGNRATTTFQVTGRHLPENFVIAAKWGDNWYALPANMTSESITEGVLIEVDDAAAPTKALAAPNTTKYGLKSVYTSNGSADRYANNGERLVFVENVEEATPVANKTLYNGGGDAQNSNKTSIQVYAQYTNYHTGAENQNRYEWIPTTTDLMDYTLTSAHAFASEAARTISLDKHGIFGTLLQDKSYSGMVRLLPVDNFYAPVELQVVEWKEDGVNIMYTGNGTKATTQIGNGTVSSVLLSDAKMDHAVYNLTTSISLTEATNQPLIISIQDDADATIGAIKLTIPAIFYGNKKSTELVASEESAKATDIVILDGATLTAGTTKYTYDNITVYPGGSLIIGKEGKLGMNSLTMRAGSSWGADKYENKYPHFLLAGEYSNTSGQINLDYVTTVDYYYPLSVPEEVTIAEIKYPTDIYGNNVDKANTGSFQLKHYDGAQRVEQGSQYGTGWVVVDESTTTTLAPNQGYAIWGIPKKINGTRQTYGIHRIPIKKAAGDLATNEKTNAEIPIKAHGINDANVLPNDKGWNYLGNPYLAGLGGMDGTDGDLQMGLLVQEVVNGQWTGGWVNNGEQVRYVTLTNDCQTFEAKPVAEAQIPAFTTFFIQAAQDGAIALTAPAKAVPASIAARQYAAQQESAKEITTGILLTGNDQTDRTGLLIADNFTEEYDFNADLSKFENSGINLYTIGKTGNLAYMAINQTLAEQPIPVGYSAPAEGLYTIAFDEDRYNATDISALYLIDYDSNEKTNLLHTDYSFVTAAGTNNQRFALQVAFAPENATNVEWVGDATVQVGVEGNTLMLNNLPNDAAVHVFDALGRLMYHAPTVPTEMQLTLPTGYYLVRIADKQNAVVIKTVIP